MSSLSARGYPLQTDNLNKYKIDRYVGQLHKEAYKQDNMNIDQLAECAICLNKFEELEEVIILECDSRHFFHQ